MLSILSCTFLSFVKTFLFSTCLTMPFTNSKRFRSAALLPIYLSDQYLPVHKALSALFPLKPAAAFTASLSPTCPEEVEMVLITGQPSFSDRSFSSIFVCFLLTNIALIQRNDNRYPQFQKLCGEKQASAQIRSIHDIDDTSGFSFLTYPLVMISSDVKGDIE